MPNQRQAIPENVKRSVRQECAFGCVICGHPIYHYDHLIDWHIVKEHVADNLVLLCPTHHQEKTGGLLSKDEVETARRNPFNKKLDYTAPYGLRYGTAESSCSIEMGTNSFGGRFGTETQHFHALVIDQIDILSFLVFGGGIYLNLCLLDELNQVVLLILANEMVFKTGEWDITFVGNRLTIREKPRTIRLELEFEIPNRVRVIRGRLLCNGVRVDISENEVLLPGIGFTVRDCEGSQGLVLGRSHALEPIPYPVPALSRIHAFNRYVATPATVDDDS